MAVSAGIDIGSTTIKLALIEDGTIRYCGVVSSSYQPLVIAEELLQKSIGSQIPLVATGYGRDLIEQVRKVKTISEIKAHALGARFLFPQCGSVIDIGGQDVKVISLDKNGRATRFEMNDRCAAGTGRFLEVMSDKLKYEMNEFAIAALAGSDGIRINSLCTVFAESEVVSLLNRGFARQDISRALHLSIVNRIKAVYNRVEATGPAAITGGGAKNPALIEFFSKSLSVDIMHSEYSQTAGAIGCALEAISLPG